MATAKSKKQQMAAGAALSAKRGERSKSSLKGASKSMVESMSEKELHDMASVERKKLPKRNTRKTSGRKASAKKASSRSTARKSGAKNTSSRSTTRKSGTKKTATRKTGRKKSPARR